jgi:hypothetical protein
LQSKGKCGVLIVSLLRYLLFKHSKKINDYFFNAVRVYALRGEEDAGCAALIAAKVAGKNQRQSMIENLSKMASNVMKNFPDKNTRKSVADRILFLKGEVENKAWNSRDFREEKGKLSKINPEYLSCLNRSDPSVFKRKYPNLF